MEIIILIGLYGSGKSTLLSSLKDEINFTRVSLDEFDINSRQDLTRISMILNLFQNITHQQIDFQNFSKRYLEYFSRTNGSLANTLFALYEIFTKNEVSESTKNSIREKVLIPSILQLFIEKIRIGDIKGKKIIIDSGAMHFIGMDGQFFY
jgi:predicted ATPase